MYDHICMKIFKVILSSAYKVRIEEFKLYQTKLFENNAIQGLRIGFKVYNPYALLRP